MNIKTLFDMAISFIDAAAAILFSMCSIHIGMVRLPEKHILVYNENIEEIAEILGAKEVTIEPREEDESRSYVGFKYREWEIYTFRDTDYIPKKEDEEYV